MILLTATTDLISIITDSAANLDVHCSYMDYAAGGVTPGRQNTAISSATTTTVLSSPGASTQRNLKTLNARNRHASLSVGVIVQFNDNSTLYQLHAATLRPGEALEYIEGVGFFVLASRLPVGPNCSTADQGLTAGSANYVTGSSILFPTNPNVGTVLQWTLSLGKTAAGTGTTAMAIYFGPNGTTADTSRCATGNLDTETAAADEAFVEITATIRGPITASCVVQSIFDVDNNLSTTGLSNTARKAQIKAVQSAAFDITGLPLYVGIVITPGASDVMTVRQCYAQVIKA